MAVRTCRRRGLGRAQTEEEAAEAAEREAEKRQVPGSALTPEMEKDWRAYIAKMRAAPADPSPSLAWLDAAAQLAPSSSGSTSSSSSRVSSASRCSSGKDCEGAPRMADRYRLAPRGLCSLGSVTDVFVTVCASVPVYVWTPGAWRHEEGKCMPCPWFIKGPCREGANCVQCHLQHVGGKKKRARPPLRIRDPGRVQREKQGRWTGNEKGMEEILAQAHAEGDAFCIDTAAYIPKFMRASSHLRQKLGIALEKYKETHGPWGEFSAGPSDSGAPPSTGKPAGTEQRELDGAEDGGVPLT